MLSIHLTDNVRLVFGDRELPLGGRKTRALLALLALSLPRGMSRDELLALLWSEQGEPAARAALRQTLHRLRDSLDITGGEILRSVGDFIQLDPSRVRVDLIDAMAAIRAGGAPALLNTTPHAFLEALAGLDFVDPNFANWLRVRRQRLHEDAVTALGEALAEVATADPAGVDIARVLLRMEPTHEAACRFLMRSYQALGQVSAAMSVYERLWKELDREFDALPSEETQRLIVEIKQAASDTIPEPAAATLPALPPTLSAAAMPPLDRTPSRSGAWPGRRPPVLRVDAFECDGLRDDDALRVIGLRHDFVAALCRFREWRVIDQVDPAPVAPALSHDTPAIAASARALRTAEGADLILTFRDIHLGDVIWSERIPVTSAAWLGLQRRAVRRLAIASSLHLSADRLARLGSVPALDLSAHDAWTLGQALMSRWRPDSDDRAEGIFRSVIDGHPDFAPAYVGLAQVLNARHHLRPGLYRSRVVHTEALDIAARGVSLDPLDAKAQLTLAWSFALNGDHDSAVQTFRIGCELNENDPWTLVSSSLGFAYCGEVTEAIQLGEHMVELGLGVTPLHWAYNAGVRFMAHDFAGAAIAAQRGTGATYYITAWQAAALAHTGRMDDARRVLARFFAQIRGLWSGPDAPTEGAMTAWLLHCYPIRSHDAWAALRDGLAFAGAPVPGTCPTPAD